MNIVKMSGGLVAFACLLATGCTPARTSASRGTIAVGSPGFGVEATTADARSARDEEASACAEVPDADRVGGPFARRDRIENVEEVRDRVFPKQLPQTFGIAVYIRATPGVTEQWLGRVIRCHQKRAAAAGAIAGDPLVGTDARIKVDTTPTGFRVAITSPDLEVARSLLDKAQGLSPNGTLSASSTRRSADALVRAY